MIRLSREPTFLDCPSLWPKSTALTFVNVDLATVIIQTPYWNFLLVNTPRKTLFFWDRAVTGLLTVSLGHEKVNLLEFVPLHAKDAKRYFFPCQVIVSKKLHETLATSLDVCHHTVVRNSDWNRSKTRRETRDTRCERVSEAEPAGERAAQRLLALYRLRWKNRSRRRS